MSALVAINYLLTGIVSGSLPYIVIAGCRPTPQRAAPTVRPTAPQPRPAHLTPARYERMQRAWQAGCQQVHAPEGGRACDPNKTPARYKPAGQPAPRNGATRKDRHG